jgi:hypothetical protein
MSATDATMEVVSPERKLNLPELSVMGSSAFILKRYGSMGRPLLTL